MGAVRFLHERLGRFGLGVLRSLSGWVPWRLTQLPKSQALEFLLVSPLRPPWVFAAEAAVGVTRLALVTLLQYAEHLSDRQAADAVRARLDWKYLLSLDLTDPGFDFVRRVT